MAPTECQESLLPEPWVSSRAQANPPSVAWTTTWSLVAGACHLACQLSVALTEGCPFPSSSAPGGTPLHPFARPSGPREKRCRTPSNQ